MDQSRRLAKLLEEAINLGQDPSPFLWMTQAREQEEEKEKQEKKEKKPIQGRLSFGFAFKMVFLLISWRF